MVLQEANYGEEMVEIGVDLHGLLKQLARERPVFHSEADFQHAFAWAIHQSTPNLGIRLEKRVVVGNQDLHVDVLVRQDLTVFPIELKYKTKGSRGIVGDEPFDLKNHGAQDCGRYDFMLDIARLESCKRYLERMGEGYIIFLTNDHLYWEAPRNSDTVDAAFRIHQGRDVSGVLTWDGRASEGTKKGRDKDIVIEERQVLNWRSYSVVPQLSHGELKYLLLKI